MLWVLLVIAGILVVLGLMEESGVPVTGCVLKAGFWVIVIFLALMLFHACA
jgi:hypothetical protein